MDELTDDLNALSRQVAAQYAERGWVDPQLMLRWRTAKAAYFAGFDELVVENSSLELGDLPPALFEIDGMDKQ